MLVHGAAEQIRAFAEAQRVQASDLEGTGVTDAQTLELALTAANRLTHEILEGLAANDLRAACPNVVTSHPLGIIQGVDHLFTGRVERIDIEFLQSLLNQGVVPVLPPLGFNGEGKTYRLNSDDVAVAAATQLKAVKLIFITSREGLIDQGQPIRQIQVSDLSQLLQRDPAGFAPEMLSPATIIGWGGSFGPPTTNGEWWRLVAAMFVNPGLFQLAMNVAARRRPRRTHSRTAVRARRGP